jgi:catechol 2,3-dioxygenase-like lactoylglutathione lyase family enzyme
MTEPIIRVADIAWGRIRSPDLDKQEEFLTRFGMIRSERTDNALYMRGTGSSHHIHVTELGDPGFVSLAFRARNEDDLHKLAAEAEDASGVEDIDEPGGGKRVRLIEPNGYTIEVVHGVAEVDEIPIQRHAYNFGNIDKYKRAGELWRVDKGPARVMRIGHGVLGTTKLEESTAWVRKHIGLIASDEVFVEGDKNKVIASFNRIDAGEQFVDHHVFLYVGNERAGLNHISFEVPDFDDVMMGHEHLRDTGDYDHVWGIGRHVLGSQIYDYWKDPWGRVHEHWADTDTLNKDYGTRYVPAEEGLNSQWGEPAPMEFINHVSP